HSERLAAPVLATLDGLIAVGDAPRDAVAGLARALHAPLPELTNAPLAPGTALLWRPASRILVRFRRTAPRAEHRRHRRKYAAGSLGEDKSFYFRGPNGALNLRAHNLALFLQMADGVDDATWLYHLERGDYSKWLGDVVKNDELRREVAAIEQRRD